MLTLKQIYDDKAKVIAGLQKKHFAGAAEAIDEVLRLDGERKAAQQQKDAAAAEMNKISKSIGALMAQGKREEAEAAKTQTGTLKAQIAEYDAKMAEAEEAQTRLLLTIPNVPYDIVPEGASAEDNLAVTIGNWPNQPMIDAIAKDGAVALKDWNSEVDEAIAAERIAQSEKREDLRCRIPGIYRSGSPSATRAHQFLPRRGEQSGLHRDHAADSGQRRFGLRHGSAARQRGTDVPLRSR